jgi:hypothetical protein
MSLFHSRPNPVEFCASIQHTSNQAVFETAQQE